MGGVAGMQGGPSRGRGHTRVRLLAGALLILVIGCVIAIAAWHRSVRELDTVTQSGLAHLSPGHTASQMRDALEAWRRANHVVLDGRLDEWLSHTLARYSIHDDSVRRMIAYVTGVDFGAREEDWRRWDEDRRRMMRGLQPAIAPRQRFEMTQRWRAAVGLTTHFSSIVPVDGWIYVASLGVGIDDPRDRADGIVRIDGRSGDAELIFEPPDRGPRDILGLAFVQDSLVAACRNGFVYCTDASGRLKWKASAGGAIASIPIVFGGGGAASANVAVATETGRIAAFRADSGKPVWTTPLDVAPRGFHLDAAARSPEQGAIRLSLALGVVPGGRDPALFVATAGGFLYCLSLSAGRPIARMRIDAAILGPICTTPASGDPGATAIIGDCEGIVWRIGRGARSVEATPLAWIDHPADPRIVAMPRTIGGGAGAPPDWIVCTAGSPTGLGGSVSRIRDGATVWRFTPGGMILAAPAIADINGDNRPEVIVVSANGSADGWWSWLSVLAEDGRLLRRVWIDSAIECPPVVVDVDGDGTLEILVADRSGLLHCIETGRIGPVEWGLAAGDPHNSANAASAYSFGQTPWGHQARWRPR